MVIKRKKKKVSGEELRDVLSDHVLEPTTDVLNKVEESKVGQVAPVKKKTRMVRNFITGVKAYSW